MAGYHWRAKPKIPKWQQERVKNTPVAVSAARAPLPSQFFGSFIVIGCELGAETFSLSCQDKSKEIISYELSEDELRALLRTWHFPDIPRLVSAARYSRKIQVIPNFGYEMPMQVISLYPKTPESMLDFGDGVDRQPVHEMPTSIRLPTGYD